MHIQSPRGFRNIVSAEFVNALNVFPTHAVRGHWIFRRLWLRSRRGEKGRHDIVGVGGFRQIVDGAIFNRRDRRGDVAETGEDDHAAVGANLM